MKVDELIQEIQNTAVRYKIKQLGPKKRIRLEIAAAALMRTIAREAEKHKDGIQRVRHQRPGFNGQEMKK